MIYKLALFLHVSGALSVSAAIAIEWICLILFRKADTIERIEESVSYYAKVGKLGDIGAFLMLIPGIYMMIAVWKVAGWAICGFLGLLAIGLIGGILTGRTMKRIAELLKVKDQPVHELRQLLSNNSLWLSIKIRTAILLGVIFLMTAKPGLTGSIITLAISIVVGRLVLPMKYHAVAEDKRVAPQGDKV
jgi:hypothetical protein